MALPRDLLDQANHLARREPRRPKQASLRRAISTAYYAIFHLLIDEVARLLAPPQPALLRPRFQRALTHTEMKTVCQQFAKGKKAELGGGTKELASDPIEPALVNLAAAFVDLQEARHQADYDTARTFIRLDVLSKISSAQQAFSDWRTVKNRPNATIFLTALLLQSRWNK